LPIVLEAIKQVADQLTSAPFIALNLMQRQPILSREDVTQVQKGRSPKN